MVTPVDPTAYTAAEVQVLAGIEAVRRRPGMYVGGTGAAAMHRMLWEVLGNAIDEHLAGHARTITVSIDGARISVDDDGRGIPADAIERVFTTLHNGTNKRPHVHLNPRLRGVGAVVTCALARELDVTVWRDGWEHVQRFEKGVAMGPVTPRAQRAHGDARGVRSRLHAPEGNRVGCALDPRAVPRARGAVSRVRDRRRRHAIPVRVTRRLRA